MATSGHDLCLFRCRVAQFYRCGLGRDAMLQVNKFVYVTPTAAAIKEVDVAQYPLVPPLVPPSNLFPVFPLVRPSPRTAYLEQRANIGLPMSPWSAWVMMTEYQGRGTPHSHITAWARVEVPGGV